MFPIQQVVFDVEQEELLDNASFEGSGFSLDLYKLWSFSDFSHDLSHFLLHILQVLFLFVRNWLDEELDRLKHGMVVEEIVGLVVDMFHLQNFVNNCFWSK